MIYALGLHIPCVGKISLITGLLLVLWFGAVLHVYEASVMLCIKVLSDSRRSSFIDIRVGWDRSRASKLFKYSISLVGSDHIDLTYPLPGA